MLKYVRDIGGVIKTNNFNFYFLINGEFVGSNLLLRYKQKSENYECKIKKQRKI